MTSQHFSIQYSHLRNLRFIFEEANSIPRRKVESYAKKYFEEKGFPLIKAVEVKDSNLLKQENGIPDFVHIGKNRDIFFVEVKHEDDKLSFSQMEWLVKNPSYVVYIFCVGVKNKVRYSRESPSTFYYEMIIRKIFSDKSNLNGIYMKEFAKLMDISIATAKKYADYFEVKGLLRTETIHNKRMIYLAEDKKKKRK